MSYVSVLERASQHYSTEAAELYRSKSVSLSTYLGNRHCRRGRIHCTHSTRTLLRMLFSTVCSLDWPSCYSHVQERKKSCSSAVPPSWGFARWVAGAQLSCPSFWPILLSCDCPRDRGPQALGLQSPAVDTNCGQQWLVVVLWAVNPAGSGGDTRLFSVATEEATSWAGGAVWVLRGWGSRVSVVTPAGLCAALVEGDGIWSTVISKIWQQLTEEKKTSRHSCNFYALK